MKRTLFVIGTLAVVAGLAAHIHFRQQKIKGLESDLTAVGLRGTSKISKPLSDLQKNRLEKHFLERPPAAHVSAHRQQNTPVETVIEVQTLNTFNQKQKP